MELENNKDYSRFISTKSPLFETLLECSVSFVPLWIAVLVGLIVGWLWKPRWVSLLFFGIRSRPRLLWTSPPGLGARRIWFAMTAITTFEMLKECWLKFRAWRWPEIKASQMSASSNAAGEQVAMSVPNLVQSVIGEEDLRDLQQRFVLQDGGLPWGLMMEREITGMAYQAWRRDPQGGPTEYRSRTVFENATPEIVRDFFWDDDFRSEWDSMIAYSESLEACARTGEEVARWVRKYPFFCGDREYLIGRRVFECGAIYYCITKGIPYLRVPRRNKLRRVDIYYSSWCIQPVTSSKTGEKTACEVTFFHSEDMGIPKEIAKLGVRLAMWGCVEKMEPGLRKYQVLRSSGKLLSESAYMAHLCTQLPASYFEEVAASACDDVAGAALRKSHPLGGWKWVVVGGAVVLALGLNRGAVGKFVLLGLARRCGRKL